MTKTLVSVIIPFFNAEEYISETILSVLGQTHTNVEIICVDDGSNDKSVEIINEIADKDHRVRLLKRERLPKSGSTCRNIGVFNASGEYVIFLDADDVLAFDCIENRLKIIEGSSYDFVVFPMASFTNDINSWSMTSRLMVKDFKHFFASGFAAWQVSSPIWRKDFFINDLKGFNESYLRLQDIELHLRAIAASDGNYKVMKDSCPDCFYRKTPLGGIRYQKMITTLKAYEQFADLLEHFYLEGVFKKKSKFSGSILIMYLTMLITTNLLYQAGVYDYDKQRITSVPLRNHLTWYDKVLFIMSLNITNPKVGASVARGMRRMCQYRFF